MKVLTKLLLLAVAVAVPAGVTIVPTRPEMLYGKGFRICSFCFLGSTNVWGPYGYLNYGSVWNACKESP